MELVHLFKQGGIVMYPLVLLSFIALAVFFERMLFYRGLDISAARMQELFGYIKQADKDSIEAMATKKAGDVLDITQSYFASEQEQQDKVQTLETMVNVKTMAYGENLAFLNIIITLAPLLGLLGTILGIISSFKVFDLKDGASHFAITSGVGEALIATAFGLIVAMFALVLYGILKFYIGKLEKKLAVCCVMLLGSQK
ncbi:MAG: MotA/TolQ/ExbB proton channel family protein [Phascolarctobacterium sp.]|nr:MotA/TolQ/ExbB proton channel family protein [Phascolarctobacterium sp.]